MYHIKMIINFLNSSFFQSEPNETLTQTVEPHNDFFAAQFLLGFPIPGLYQVREGHTVFIEVGKKSSVV